MVGQYSICADRDLKPSTPGRIDAIGRELATSAFISFDGEKFRFLTEMLLNNFEKDIERFQFGYKFFARNRNTLWLGSLYNPAGIWNIEHHHGAYLQTSISRLNIVAHGDGGGGQPVGGGVLPMELTGLLREGSRFAFSCLPEDESLKAPGTKAIGALWDAGS